jgi:16S rRNA processing protein RimM
MRPHGIRGEVVVAASTDRPAERFAGGARLHRAGDGDVVVRTARPHGDRWLLALAGVTTRDQAEALRGVELSADVEPREAGEPDEFHVAVLLGARVRLTDGVVVGTVAAVEQHPMQDLLVVAVDDREVRVPFVRALVPVVDLDNGELVIDPPEGLLDDEGGDGAPRRGDDLP